MSPLGRDPSMSGCGQELCRNWTGDGCACEVLDLPKPSRVSAERSAAINTWVAEQLAHPGTPKRRTRHQEHVIRTVLANDEALKRKSSEQATA